MATTQVVLPRTGVFGVIRQGEKVVAEPTVAVFLQAASTYSVDHPSSRGDRCTVLVFDPEVLGEAIGDDLPTATQLSARTQLLTRSLLANETAGDDLDREETSIWLLALLASERGGRSDGRSPGSFQRNRVNQVRELLASRPEGPWRLGMLAESVNVSTFHLARQFRDVTGTTVGSYLLSLRLSMALDRILEGESSLARVASETGFAHHSHLTERFRSVFGMTPSKARRDMSRRLHERLRSTLPGTGFVSP